MLNYQTDYQVVAASQTDKVLGGQSGVGASGNILTKIVIVPATSAAGVVSIKDGTGSSISLFAGGGTTALSDLKPLVVDFGPMGMRSTSGAWKVTTGANVSVVAVGRFT